LRKYTVIENGNKMLTELSSKKIMIQNGNDDDGTDYGNMTQLTTEMK